jgi:hypothetical protein
MTDVGELGGAVHIDDVAGFDVAMDEPVLVQVFQGRGQGQPKLDAFLRREFPARREFGAQRPWHVPDWIDPSTGRPVIRRLHDREEETRCIVPPHVQHVDQPGMRSRDRHEVLQAAELAFIRDIARERVAFHDLDGVIESNGVAREPDFAVGAFSDPPHQRVIRDHESAVPCPGGLGLRSARGLSQRPVQDISFEPEPMEMTPERPGERGGNLRERDDGPWKPAMIPRGFEFEDNEEQDGEYQQRNTAGRQGSRATESNAECQAGEQHQQPLVARGPSSQSIVADQVQERRRAELDSRRVFGGPERIRRAELIGLFAGLQRGGSGANEDRLVREPAGGPTRHVAVADVRQRQGRPVIIQPATRHACVRNRADAPAGRHGCADGQARLMFRTRVVLPRDTSGTCVHVHFGDAPAGRRVEKFRQRQERLFDENLAARRMVQSGGKDNAAVSFDGAGQVRIGFGCARLGKHDVEHDQPAAVVCQPVEQLRVKIAVPVGCADLTQLVKRSVVHVDEHQIVGRRSSVQQEKQIVTEKDRPAAGHEQRAADTRAQETARQSAPPGHRRFVDLVHLARVPEAYAKRPRLDSEIPPAISFRWVPCPGQSASDEVEIRNPGLPTAATQFLIAGWKFDPKPPGLAKWILDLRSRQAPRILGDGLMLRPRS